MPAHAQPSAGFFSPPVFAFFRASTAGLRRTGKKTDFNQINNHSHLAEY